MGGMGQGLSCGEPHEDSLFSAVQNGELEILEAMADEDPTVFQRTTVHGRLSPLHIVAANGQIQKGGRQKPLVSGRSIQI
ncbi:hypothetical protein U1Q18_033323 [Sarracenia purpurea var. burkii]